MRIRLIIDKRLNNHVPPVLAQILLVLLTFFNAPISTNLRSSPSTAPVGGVAARPGQKNKRTGVCVWRVWREPMFTADVGGKKAQFTVNTERK